MSAFLPFLTGLAAGGMAVWFTLWLTATESPARPHTRNTESLTVQRIAARIKQENLQGEQTGRELRTPRPPVRFSGTARP